MANDKQHDWVDTVSKLLIPVVIFVAGFVFSYQKDRADRANQQFERESGILKLAASTNEAERLLGLKIVEIELREGKFSPEMLPVVQAISQGRPSDASTQAAQSILTTAAKQDLAPGNQILTTPGNQTPTVFLQIAKDEQRSLANDLRAKLTASGFAIPGIELVSRGTSNTYVRYFSAVDKPQADKILEVMQKMGFDVKAQDFTASQDKVPAGQLEVWIGEKQGALSNQ